MLDLFLGEPFPSYIGGFNKRSDHQYASFIVESGTYTINMNEYVAATFFKQNSASVISTGKNCCRLFELYEMIVQETKKIDNGDQFLT